MTPKEKLRFKELLVRMWYYGEVDRSIGQLCRMVGWKPLNMPCKIGSFQQSEIEALADVIEDEIKRKRPVKRPKKFQLIPEREVA